MEGDGGDFRHRLRGIGSLQIALLMAVQPRAQSLRRDSLRGRLPGLDQDCRRFGRPRLTGQQEDQ